VKSVFNSNAFSYSNLNWGKGSIPVICIFISLFSAAIATLEKMRDKNVQKYLIYVGREIKRIWQNAAENNDIKIHITGIDPLPQFRFEYENALELKTLFTQLMLKKGFLASTGFYASLAHKDELITKYGIAVKESISIISQAIKNNSINQKLNGPICHSGFKRLN